LQQLHAMGVAHFDVKCDNVLLRAGATSVIARIAGEYARSVSSDGRGATTTTTATIATASMQAALQLLPLVCFTDFGESVFHASMTAHQLPIDGSRGTECIKAPELQQHGEQRQSDVNSPTTLPTSSLPQSPSSAAFCDVWSAGCLLYELITSKFLFMSDDVVLSPLQPGLIADGDSEATSPLAYAAAGANAGFTPTTTTGSASNVTWQLSERAERLLVDAHMSVSQHAECSEAARELRSWLRQALRVQPALRKLPPRLTSA
jgi:serine/threonine protein kinase